MGTQEIPKEHKFVVSNVASQHLAIFSHTAGNIGDRNSPLPPCPDKLSLEYEEKKRMEGKKSRDDKDKVQEILFALFEKHQYYNIKDLIRETNQPVTYLKSILNEVCNYNVKNPHKNMWELKPEYRHYQKNSDDEAKKKDGDASSDDDCF